MDTAFWPRLPAVPAIRGLMALAMTVAALAQRSTRPESVADLADRLLAGGRQHLHDPEGGQASAQVPMPELPPGSPFQDFFDDFFKDQQRGDAAPQPAR